MTQKKIAILGSAPSSVQLAPFGDSSWQIWGCSPGCYPHAKRADAWFEIHRWEPGAPWFSKEYIKFMAELKGPVYMIQPVAEIPNSVAFPISDMFAYHYGQTVNHKGEVRKSGFDASTFSSTIAYMMALAIMQGADVIGLWGVDMSATEEWFFQRSGCQAMINIAKSVGIQVVVPPESDLMRPPPLYGFCEVGPDHVKLLARKAELQGRLNVIVANAMNMQREADHLKGALDELEYRHKTWTGNPYSLYQDNHDLIEGAHDAAAAERLVAEAAELDTGIRPMPRIELDPEDWRTLEANLARDVIPEPMAGGTVTIPSTTLDELQALSSGQPNGSAHV